MSRIYFPFLIVVLTSILTAGIIWLANGALGPWQGFSGGSIATELWSQTAGMSRTTLTIIGAEQALFRQKFAPSSLMLVRQAWRMALLQQALQELGGN